MENNYDEKYTDHGRKPCNENISCPSDFIKDGDLKIDRCVNTGEACKMSSNYIDELINILDRIMSTSLFIPEKKLLPINACLYDIFESRTKESKNNFEIVFGEKFKYADRIVFLYLAALLAKENIRVTDESIIKDELKALMLPIPSIFGMSYEDTYEYDLMLARMTVIKNKIPALVTKYNASISQIPKAATSKGASFFLKMVAFGLFAILSTPLLEVNASASAVEQPNSYPFSFSPSGIVSVNPSTVLYADVEMCTVSDVYIELQRIRASKSYPNPAIDSTKHQYLQYKIWKNRMKENFNSFSKSIENTSMLDTIAISIENFVKIDNDVNLQNDRLLVALEDSMSLTRYNKLIDTFIDKAIKRYDLQRKIDSTIWIQRKSISQIRHIPLWVYH
jgi:hypothetical protein